MHEYHFCCCSVSFLHFECTNNWPHLVKAFQQTLSIKLLLLDYRFPSQLRHQPACINIIDLFNTEWRTKITFEKLVRMVALLSFFHICRRALLGICLALHWYTIRISRLARDL